MFYIHFIKNGKERKERNVLLKGWKRTEKNGKNGTFFMKERKRTERMERSFEKNGCPTLLVGQYSDSDRVSQSLQTPSRESKKLKPISPEEREREKVQEPDLEAVVGGEDWLSVREPQCECSSASGEIPD